MGGVERTEHSGATARVVVSLLALTLAGCNCSPMIVVPADGGLVGGGAGGSGGGAAGGQGGGAAGGAGGGTAVDAGTDAGTDAGMDGGTDGGMDAGLPQTCTGAAQCTKPPPSQSLCTFATVDAGNSCIQGQCVYECFKGRTCDFDAGTSCLACSTPPTTECVQPGCGAATLQGSLESSTCAVGFTNVMLVPLGNCQWRVMDATGTKGVVTRLANGHYVGVFDDHGTCVGSSTFGQVERAVFSCPNCQFQLAL